MFVTLYTNAYINRSYLDMKYDPDLKPMMVSDPTTNLKYIDQERDEFKQEYHGPSLTGVYGSKLKEEYGDLLYSVVMLGKSLNLNPVERLLRTARKVTARTKLAKGMPDDCTWEEKWESAKRRLDTRR